MKPRSPAQAAKAGQVRIIGGAWRGTRLPVPVVQGLRPTPDRVRETLFNWLQPLVPGARVLDLFAGSGALGLEALSRGAREAVLVEADPQAAQALRQSIEKLHAQAAAHVVRADAIAWLQAPLFGRFDGVFLDPPFAADAWQPVLARLEPWLADGAWLYLESPADAAVEPGNGWHLHRQGTTRETRYALYRRALESAATLADIATQPSSSSS